MFWDYAESILQLSSVIVMLLVCLFRYINSKSRSWFLMVALFLCMLVSGYFWTAYLLIMGELPNATELMTYAGWNIAFLILLVLVLHRKTREELRYFHPLMLVPIPLNYYQLTLYLPYGGVLNNAYMVTVMTAVAVFSLQGILWYLKKRKEGAEVPYVALAALLYAVCEFGMWTTSCFDGWIAKMYYAASMLASATHLLLVWAVRRAEKTVVTKPENETRRRLEGILKAVYLTVVVLVAFGGIWLGNWMKDRISAGVPEAAESGVYDIIPVILFVFSLVIVAFAVAIIFVVHFSQKAAEADRLREEKALAEHSNEVKSEFLANMSHEIRTPVNTILGMNEIILRESREARDRLPEKQDPVRNTLGEICDCAGHVESAGNSLLALVNDILDFSKIEAGRLELHEAPYRLGELLSDVSRVIRLRAEAKELTYSIRVDPRLPDSLYGDPVRVRQILSNLLSNAVKYTDSGSVALDVRCGSGGEPVEGGAIDLVMAVEDTGIGIREEDMGRLFEKFGRLELKRNSTVEGTGLGLAITRNLLDLMGGRVEVSSEYGRGSVFTVHIPQTVVSAEPIGDFRESAGRAARKSAGTGEAFEAPGARILIVDDTRMNLEVAAGLLKKTRVAVDRALSGEEAVGLARGTAYDLILMDQRMPGMDGTEALHRIRAAGDGPNAGTPVICLTADAVSGAKEKYLAEGFTDYLSKPVDGGALERTLLAYLPPEKVERRREEPAEADPAEEAEEGICGVRAEELRKAGIRPESGLEYCQRDAGLYRDILQEFRKDAEGRAEDMRRALEQKDWRQYGILAHSLKGTSRMIGAGELSWLAARLETAATEGKEEEVAACHGEALRLYRETAAAIGRACESGGTETEAGVPGGFGAVLEFPPEE